MGDYQPNPREVKRRPSPSASESSRLFRNAAANHLEALGEHRRAFRVRTCRPRKEGGYSCRDRVLCDHCRNVDAIQAKRNYISRVLTAMSDAEPRLLLCATLTMGESKNLDARCKQIQNLLRDIPGMEGAWSKVEGMFWILHEERGESRRTWRPHYHVILVVKTADFVGFKQHYRRLAIEWARAAWAVLHPRNPIPKSEEPGSPFRTLLESQDVRPLDCFQSSNLRSLQGSEHDRRALVADLSALIEYGLKRKKQDESHPRGPRMRPRDYVKVALRTNNKRGVKGCLHGIAPEVRRQALQELEGLVAPVEAEQNGRTMSTKRKK